ncbi:39S ribosomal protein L54, mitochondrial [Elysia marginata]|uniref:Large ribosomal subunit protein mL54 n=1 Tax=Elysia marginata TaxID=1093978 RepID=A0AAV4F031_9GAST|nr:39S ribosomal protein L54, mitochondrial [Elysia marginata]
MAISLKQGLSFLHLQAYYQASRLICRSYAKKIGKVGGAAAQKARMEVETDPQKLLTHCCGANIFLEGTDPDLKADQEYPDWLWNLRTERGGQELSELDPDTMAYWRRLSHLTSQRNARVSKRLLKLRAIQYPDDSLP